MQNQEGLAVDADTMTVTLIQTSEIDVEDWENFKDDDIMQQQSAIQAKEAEKIPFVGDKRNMQNQEGLAVDADTMTVTLIQTSESDVEDWANFKDDDIMQQRNMQNQEGLAVDADTMTVTLIQTSESDVEDWANFKDDDIMQQQSAIQAKEAEKIPFVGDKEPLSSLAVEYKSGNAILLEKIKVLITQYAGIRRTRGDGNCFFRSFMFAYLEHILESQDRAEVDRITVSVEQCRKTLLNLGYAEFTFEDFFALFLEQLENVLEGSESFISHNELVHRSRDQSVSDYVVMFFRFVSSGEIRKRSEFYEPFIQGLTNTSVEQFCKSMVEPMGEESDHVHITALSEALGVPIRVVYLDRSSCDNGNVIVNHHDFIPSTRGDLATNGNVGNSETLKPFITLLYRPGHYDILYPK